MCQINFFYNPLYEPPDRQKSSVYMPSPVPTTVQTLAFLTRVSDISKNNSNAERIEMEILKSIQTPTLKHKGKNIKQD